MVLTRVIQKGNFKTMCPGRIQDEDVSSESELITRGSDKTHLINNKKIYVDALGINKTLYKPLMTVILGAAAVDQLILTRLFLKTIVAY